MIFVALILFAALPHTDNVWTQTVIILIGGFCAAMWNRDLIAESMQQLARNQKSIYEKVSKNG